MTTCVSVRLVHYGLILLLSVLALAGFAPVPAQAQVSDPRYLLGTYLGGSQSDYGRAVAVDAQGYIYLAGDTFSSTFSGFDLDRSGGRDVLVLKLSPDGSEVLDGTVIGSPADDEVIGMVVTPAGEPILSIMPGGDWPTQAAINPQPLRGNEGVLVKFDSHFNLVFSTYAHMHMVSGGGQNLAIDHNGTIYLTGDRFDGGRDLIVQKYSPDGQHLFGEIVWNGDRTTEYGHGIAVGPDGSAYVTGVVSGDSTFPVTADAAQSICGRKLALGVDRSCDEDAFVVILTPEGRVRYASYLGGIGADQGVDIAVDALGGIVVVGTTFAPDFPTTEGALLPRCHVDNGSCHYDTFVTRFHPDGSVAYSTYLNSNDASSMDFTAQVVTDAAGNATVLGRTSGERFPLQQPIQSALDATPCVGSAFTRFCYDAFITTLSPDGVVRFSSYLGGNGDENPEGLALGSDGTLYVTGSTSSSNFPVTAGARQTSSSGGSDFFFARIRLDGLDPSLPSPSGDTAYRVYLSLVIK